MCQSKMFGERFVGTREVFSYETTEFLLCKGLKRMTLIVCTLLKFSDSTSDSHYS